MQPAIAPNFGGRELDVIDLGFLQADDVRLVLLDQCRVVVLQTELVEQREHAQAVDVIRREQHVDAARFQADLGGIAVGLRHKGHHLGDARGVGAFLDRANRAHRARPQPLFRAGTDQRHQLSEQTLAIKKASPRGAVFRHFEQVKQKRKERFRRFRFYRKPSPENLSQAAFEAR